MHDEFKDIRNHSRNGKGNQSTGMNKKSRMINQQLTKINVGSLRRDIILTSHTENPE